MTGPVATGGRAAHGDRAYGFSSAARMEWLKLRTLRSQRWTTLVLLAAVIGIGIAAEVYYPSHWAHMTAAQRASFDPTNQGFTGMALGQLAAGIAGVVVMTSEYSTGSIRSTLAAIPNRPLLLAAKAAVFGGVALVVGELACVASFLVSQYLVLSAPAPHASLADPAALRAVLMLGAYVSLIGLLGLGLGAIIRHTAGAIAAVVGVVFAVPLVLQAFPASVHDEAQKFLPMLIAEDSLGAVKPTADALSPWVGLAVLAGYAVVVLLAGCWLLVRRDA
jgi:ABC-2 type transport system permease protein